MFYLYRVHKIIPLFALCDLDLLSKKSGHPLNMSAKFDNDSYNGFVKNNTAIHNGEKVSPESERGTETVFSDNRVLSI